MIQTTSLFIMKCFFNLLPYIYIYIYVHINWTRCMNKIFRIENIRNACFSFSYSIVIHRFCFVFRHEECLSWKNLKKKKKRRNTREIYIWIRTKRYRFHKLNGHFSWPLISSVTNLGLEQSSSTNKSNLSTL